MKNNKDVVAGLGEIGKPILKLLSKSQIVVGYDINSKLMDQKKFAKHKNLDTHILHVCIPFSNKFQIHVKSLYKKFSPFCKFSLFNGCKFLADFSSHMFSKFIAKFVTNPSSFS